MRVLETPDRPPAAESALGEAADARAILRLPNLLGRNGLEVVRRFDRSLEHFERVYRPLADRWSMYDNSGTRPRLLERGP